MIHSNDCTDVLEFSPADLAKFPVNFSEWLLHRFARDLSKLRSDCYLPDARIINDEGQSVLFLVAEADIDCATTGIRIWRRHRMNQDLEGAAAEASSEEGYKCAHESCNFVGTFGRVSEHEKECTHQSKQFRFVASHTVFPVVKRLLADRGVGICDCDPSESSVSSSVGSGSIHPRSDPITFLEFGGMHFTHRGLYFFDIAKSIRAEEYLNKFTLDSYGIPENPGTKAHRPDGTSPVVGKKGCAGMVCVYYKALRCNFGDACQLCHHPDHGVRRSQRSVVLAQARESVPDFEEIIYAV